MGDAYEREQYVSYSALEPGIATAAGWSLAITGGDNILTEYLRQNNALLNSLSSKVSALKSVTVDIYDNARDQETLDQSVRCPLHHPLRVVVCRLRTRLWTSSIPS